MQVVYQSCCGMDVHKRFVVACLLWQGADGQPHKEIRRYDTMTGDLLQCIDWLQARGCTHVAMESTGVYWKPVFTLMEGRLDVVVVNAQHMRIRAWPKNGHQRCGVDRRAGAAWLTQSQLHSPTPAA